MLTPRPCVRHLPVLRSNEQQRPLRRIAHGIRGLHRIRRRRNPATERLLLEFDWKDVIHCFERAKKTTSKDFAERTRSALENEGIVPSDDDFLVIQALSKVARKAGSADDEFREFFERRREQLETDVQSVPGVGGVCPWKTDRMHRSVSRYLRLLAPFYARTGPQEPAYLVLEGINIKPTALSR